MADIDLRSIQVNIYEDIGASILLSVTCLDNDGEAANISGITFTANVMRSGNVVKAFGVAVGGDSGNVVSLSLSSSDTSAIGTGEGYSWWLKAVGGGSSDYWVSGKFQLWTPGAGPSRPSISAMTVVVGANLTATINVGVPTDMAVSSVNEQSGAVVLSALDVGAVSRINGGGELIAALTSVSGATELNLASGNVQHIKSTAGNYTLGTPITDFEGVAVAFTLIVDTTLTGHTPAWFGNLAWAGGYEPSIVWSSGVRQIFQFITVDGTNWMGWHLTPVARRDSETFSTKGDLAVSTGHHKIFNDSGQDRTIMYVRASVWTAPDGDDVIVDVLQNGSSLFMASGFAIVDGTTTTLTVPDTTTWTNGSYLTVDIDQVGSSTAGADLTTTVTFIQGGA